MQTFLTKISRDKVIKYLLIAPITLVLFFVIIYPFIYSIWLSTHDVTIMNYFNPPFYGIRNYIDILRDSFFWNSLRITFIFVILATSMELIVGFILALLANRNLRGTNIFMYIFLAPVMISPVVVGLLFRMGLNHLYGIIPYYLKVLLNFSSPLLENRQLALLTLIGIDVWQWTPFVFLILYAGFQSLPKEPFEAASVEGASSCQILRYITIPMLKPFIVIAAIFRAMDTFKVFDTVYIITKGAPGKATETITLYIERLAYTEGRIGLGATVTIILLIFVSTLFTFSIRYLYTRAKER